MAIIINHPNAKNVLTTLDLQGGVSFTVVVVETDLALNTGDPRYNASKVKGLAETATHALADNNYEADMIRLVELAA